MPFPARFIVVMVTGLCALPAAHAQNYPARPVRMLVGTAPGGPQDAIARGVGQVLTQKLGQPFVIENRVGADGIIAGEACARAQPDGYTICSNDNWAIALNPLTHLKLPYDPVRDLTPIIHYGFLAAAILAHPSVPANSMPELLELARAKPGTITWGSYGISSASNLYMEWLKNARGITFLNVPYKSAGLVWPAMLAGEVQISYLAVGLAAPTVKAGKAKALAVIGPSTRSPIMPEVPTYSEAGLEFNIGTWFGLFAPSGTPREIVSRPNAEIARELFNNPPARERFLTGIGMAIELPAGGPPEAFAELIGREREKLAKIVKIVGIKPQ